MIQQLSSSKTEKKEKIVKWIRDRVDYSQEQARKPYTFHRDVSFSDCQLPCMADMSPQLRNLYIKSVIDEDMKSDLEDSRSINWFPQAIKVLPVNVPKDGNCLLHAASVAVWGVEDSRNTLRDLMLMTVKNNHNFKKRWWSQLMRDLQSLEINQPEVIDQEWDDVIRSISDLGSSTLSIAVPHRFLEGIHIYILANILRRPIIIVTSDQARSLAGHDLQENHIGGLYLPLEWTPIECCKTPIILGYSFSHFSPLISETYHRYINSPHRSKDPLMFPLVRSDLGFLLVRFLKEEEDPQAWDLVQSYLLVKEVDIENVSSDTLTKAPFAQMLLKPLEPEQNSLFEHFELLKERFMEAEFLKASRGQLYATMGSAQQSNHPFYDIEMNSQTEVIPVGTLKGKSEYVKDPGQSRGTRNQNILSPCIAEGCTKQGSTNLENFCHDCFRILSAAEHAGISVFPSERNVLLNLTTNPTTAEIKNLSKLTSETTLNSNEGNALTPTAPLMSIEPQSQHGQLLSMMAERCTNHCGYRCSYKTYPYCHDCYQIKIQETKKLEQSNIIVPAPCEISEIMVEKSRSEDKGSSGEGTKGLSDAEVFDMNQTVINPSLPSPYLTIASSKLNSPHLTSPVDSWLLGSEDHLHMFHMVSCASEQFPKTGCDIMADRNCKNFEHCFGQKMLDHDICFSCSKDEKRVESNIENVETESHLQKAPGKSDRPEVRAMLISVEQAKTEGNFKGFAESFAETDIKNLIGDIEVSEEPSCKAKCASPYCDNFIFPPDKLCSKCKDILKKGYEQSQEYIRKTISKATEDHDVKNVLHKKSAKLPLDSKQTEIHSLMKNIESNLEEYKTPFEIPFDYTLKRTLSEMSRYGSRPPKKGKPCLVPLCPNYGDPQMDNKCTPCYLKSNPSAKFQGGLEASKKSEKPKRVITERLQLEDNSQLSPSSKQKERLHFVHQEYSLIPKLTTNSSGAKTAPVIFSTSLHANPLPPSYSNHQSFHSFGVESSTSMLASSDLSHPESKSVMVTSKTGHNTYESLHQLPVDSSYSFVEKADENFNKTIQGIEMTWKSSAKKCAFDRCQNYGNKGNEGYCNACYKVIRKQRVLEREAKRGEDVPDRGMLDCA